MIEKFFERILVLFLIVIHRSPVMKKFASVFWRVYKRFFIINIILLLIDYWDYWPCSFFCKS